MENFKVNGSRNLKKKLLMMEPPGHIFHESKWKVTWLNQWGLRLMTRPGNYKKNQKNCVICFPIFENNAFHSLKSSHISLQHTFHNKQLCYIKNMCWKRTNSRMHHQRKVYRIYIQAFSSFILFFFFTYFNLFIDTTNVRSSKYNKKK